MYASPKFSSGSQTQLNSAWRFLNRIVAIGRTRVWRRQLISVPERETQPRCRHRALDSRKCPLIERGGGDRRAVSGKCLDRKRAQLFWLHDRPRFPPRPDIAPLENGVGHVPCTASSRAGVAQTHFALSPGSCLRPHAAAHGSRSAPSTAFRRIFVTGRPDAGSRIAVRSTVPSPCSVRCNTCRADHARVRRTHRRDAHISTRQPSPSSLSRHDSNAVRSRSEPPVH